VGKDRLLPQFFLSRQLDRGGAEYGGLKILYRYVGGEALYRAGAILLIIGGMMVLDQILRYVSDVASGEIPLAAVVQLLLLVLPRILSLALPLALFFGLLTTVARLSQDSELDALRAAGVGLYQLLPVVVVLGALGLALEAGLKLVVEPASERRFVEAMAAFQDRPLTGMLNPGQFNELPGGRILYFEPGGKDTPMREIFYFDPGGPVPSALSARGGSLDKQDDGRVQALFREGRRLDLAWQDAQRRLTRFDRYRVVKPLSGGGGNVDLGPEARSTPDLVAVMGAQGDKGRTARLHLAKRLVMPLSVPILLVLGLALGVEGRRQGRSFGLLVGGLIVLGYHQVLLTLEKYILQGQLEAHALLWMAPGGLALVGWHWLRQRVWRRPLLGLPAGFRKAET
jgi:lipopolysaccharide export system permease protein